MGIADMLSSLLGQSGGADVAKVGGGLMTELENHPGGVSGIFQSFQQNGLGGLVQQWSGGQTGPATTDQIQQGLGSTGIIDKIATRTGMSPDTIKVALAAVVPLVIHHVVSNGHVTPEGQPTGTPAPDSSSMLQSILAKIA